MEARIEEIEGVVAKLLPDEDVRQSCLEAFCESINRADMCGGDKWGTYFQKDRIRLLVGNLIVCTIHENALWLALDAEALNSFPDKYRKLDSEEGWKRDLKGEYSEYSQVPSINGYYKPQNASEDVRRAVENLHFEFVEKAAAKYQSLNKRTRSNHNQKILYYISQYLQKFVPRPEFGATKVTDGNPFADTAELRNGHSDLTETEREAVVQSRVGQGNFRRRLIQYWSGCAVTGCEEISLLRASHIKPWRDSDNRERLDVYNGFLLLPNFDCAFDQGLLTFSNDGEMIVSAAIRPGVRDALGLRDDMKVSKIDDRHVKYLEYHRKNVFESR